MGIDSPKKITPQACAAKRPSAVYMRIERESETDHIVLLTLSETGWAIWYNKVVVRHPLQDDLDVRWLSVGVLV